MTTFGKLFKKLIYLNSDFANLSNNKLSLLSYKEVRSMAKYLFSKGYIDDPKYMTKGKKDLDSLVYNALKKI